MVEVNQNKVVLILGLLINLFFAPFLCCPVDQKQSLLDFKSSFLNATMKLALSNHRKLSFNINWQSWNASQDCCSTWARVTCDSRRNSTGVLAVTALDLTDLFSLSENPWQAVAVNTAVLAPLFRIKSLAALSISRNNFRGEIPAQLYHLSRLQKLDLSDNLLTGGLSRGVGKLVNFVGLWVDRNSLEGIIPAEIGNLTKLQFLSMGYNHFSGGIPGSIVNMKGLRVLELSKNSLSKEIPSEIGSLFNLETLDLSKNNISGSIPQSMHNLTRLKILDLQGNILTGEIPSFLLDISSLEQLHLGGNSLKWKNSLEEAIVPECRLSELSLQSCGLEGEIPDWISTQEDLSYLDLSQNALQGALPSWLAQMQVEIINFLENNLAGFASSGLFHFYFLSFLDLSHNNFSGELPKDIGNATLLYVLNLSRNQFSGTIPTSIANLSSLQELDLSNNRFSGKTFPDLRQNPFLVYLDLSQNEFSGEVPLASLPTQTRLLALGKNSFSGTLPKTLTNMSHLEHLDLHNNMITGEFPEFITQISTLKRLSLRNNRLVGSLPHKISNLSHLQILDLSSNSFTGNIPAELGNLPGMSKTRRAERFSPSISNLLFRADIRHLEWMVNWKRSKQTILSKSINLYSLLDLSDNQFGGEIPASLGKLKALKMLNISHNTLSGQIPSSFGNLECMESLDLSHNNLSGSIPESFMKLLQITTLDLSNNHLSGKIPTGSQMNTINDLASYANNSGLCGFQIQVPCSQEDLPLPTTQQEECDDEKEEVWFDWEGMLIGFPFGLFITLYILAFSSQKIPDTVVIGKREDGLRRGRTSFVSHVFKCLVRFHQLSLIVNRTVKTGLARRANPSRPAKKAGWVLILKPVL